MIYDLRIMSVFEAVLLGGVQGLTEFLPVSSSGHLVIAQKLLPAFEQPGVLFDVVLHLGTASAIIVYYWRQIRSMSVEYAKKIILGSIPAFLVGVMFSDLLEGFFESLLVVGVSLLISGTMNFVVNRTKGGGREVGNWESVKIGVAQAVAIIPGISRSGSTIFAGVVSGVSRQKAAEFSFLLSLPAVLGAAFLQVFKYGSDSSLELGVYTVGFVAALVSGYFAIKMVISFLGSKRYGAFAYYCFAVGYLVILLDLLL